MRPPTEAASPVVTDGYGSTSTMYRRIVFWTDLTFSRRSQHAYAVKQKGQLVGWRLSVSSSERRDVRHRESFRPQNSGASLRLLRNAAIIGTYPCGVAPCRNPITGIAACCARAASGHAAPPPRSVMN